MNLMLDGFRDVLWNAFFCGAGCFGIVPSVDACLPVFFMMNIHTRWFIYSIDRVMIAVNGP